MNNHQPLTRKEKRKKARAKKKILLGAVLSVSVVASAGLFIGNTIHSSAFDKPYNILPQEITSYSEASLLNLTENSKGLNKFTTLFKEQKDSSEIDNFSKNVTTYAKSAKDTIGLGAKYIEVKYGNNKTLYLFNYVSKNIINGIIKSENCSTQINQIFCGDKTILTNGWAIAGDTEYYNKETIKTKNLSLNSSFVKEMDTKEQADINYDHSLLTLWDTNSKKYQSFLPMNLGSTLPANNHMVSRITLNNTINVDTKIFPKDKENHAMFTTNKSTPNIAELPKNSVLAIGVQNASDLADLVIKDKKSYVNESDTWKALVKSLQEWGMKGENQKLILGSYSSLSLNEGSVGNRVSGVLSLKSSDEKKLLEIMNKAAKQDPNIILNYEILKKGESLDILSHSPINEGTLNDNNKYHLLNKNNPLTANNVLSLFIDVDGLYDLTDSKYKIDETNKEGLISLNVNNIDGILHSKLIWMQDITDKEPEDTNKVER